MLNNRFDNDDDLRCFRRLGWLDRNIWDPTSNLDGIAADYGNISTIIALLGSLNVYGIIA
jgi:hypothetical protein